jgi:sugar-phosphatase
LKYFASGLLFDNDGVLVDSHSAAVEAWGQWADEFAPHVNWNDPANAGQRAEDLVRRWIASPDLFEQANDRINQLEQDSAHALDHR